MLGDLGWHVDLQCVVVNGLALEPQRFIESTARVEQELHELTYRWVARNIGLLGARDFEQLRVVFLACTEQALDLELPRIGGQV
jgi:hypothetical protein